MAEIVNLRQARKKKARGEKEKQAADNRLRFGRTKAEKKATASEREREQRLLESHRRDGESDD